jgi:hypothetical protein
MTNPVWVLADLAGQVADLTDRGDPPEEVEAIVELAKAQAAALEQIHSITVAQKIAYLEYLEKLHGRSGA